MTRGYFVNHTDIDTLFENDKWYEWTAKELRKLIKATRFDYIFFSRLSILVRYYDILDPLIIKTSKERCIAAKSMTEVHYADEGKMPQPQILDRLASWILSIDQADDTDILTDRQMRTRNKEMEVSFHTPESNIYAMERDGNRYVKPRPNMDSEESQKVKVKMPSDEVDMRVYNSRLDKYSTQMG